jgi:hypothetical protein
MHLPAELHRRLIQRDEERVRCPERSENVVLQISAINDMITGSRVLNAKTSRHTSNPPLLPEQNQTCRFPILGYSELASCRLAMLAPRRPFTSSRTPTAGTSYIAISGLTPSGWPFAFFDQQHWIAHLIQAHLPPQAGRQSKASSLGHGNGRCHAAMLHCCNASCKRELHLVSRVSQSDRVSPLNADFDATDGNPPPSAGPAVRRSLRFQVFR